MDWRGDVVFGWYGWDFCREKSLGSCGAMALQPCDPRSAFRCSHQKNDIGLFSMIDSTDFLITDLTEPSQKRTRLQLMQDIVMHPNFLSQSPSKMRMLRVSASLSSQTKLVQVFDHINELKGEPNLVYTPDNSAAQMTPQQLFDDLVIRKERIVAEILPPAGSGLLSSRCVSAQISFTILDLSILSRPSYFVSR